MSFLKKIAHTIARPHYESDTTVFLKQLKAERPHLEEAQRYGRSLLWDKSIDRELQAELQADRLAQGAYVYYPMGSVRPK